jgi:hypothetical protein
MRLSGNTVDLARQSFEFLVHGGLNEPCMGLVAERDDLIAVPDGFAKHERESGPRDRTRSADQRFTHAHDEFSFGHESRHDKRALTRSIRRRPPAS